MTTYSKIVMLLIEQRKGNDDHLWYESKNINDQIKLVDEIKFPRTAIRFNKNVYLRAIVLLSSLLDWAVTLSANFSVLRYFIVSSCSSVTVSMLDIISRINDISRIGLGRSLTENMSNIDRINFFLRGTNHTTGNLPRDFYIGIRWWGFKLILGEAVFWMKPFQMIFLIHTVFLREFVSIFSWLTLSFCLSSLGRSY